MAEEPSQVLTAAIATNIEALSITPKVGDDNLTLAKKHLRSLKQNENAISLLQQSDFTTSHPEVYMLPGTYPHVLEKEGAMGLTAIRATLMAMFSSHHKHIMGDVIRLLGVLGRLAALLKDTVTPFQAWAIVGPIVEVMQAKVDYMVSRNAAPSTPLRGAPDTPIKRQRDDEQVQDGGRGVGGGRNGRGRGGRKNNLRSW